MRVTPGGEWHGQRGAQKGKGLEGDPDPEVFPHRDVDRSENQVRVVREQHLLDVPLDDVVIRRNVDVPIQRVPRSDESRQQDDDGEARRVVADQRMGAQYIRPEAASQDPHRAKEQPFAHAPEDAEKDCVWEHQFATVRQCSRGPNDPVTNKDDNGQNNGEHDPIDVTGLPRENPRVLHDGGHGP